MKFVTINWSNRYPDYKDRMQAISRRANGWFNSSLLDLVTLVEKE